MQDLKAFFDAYRDSSTGVNLLRRSGEHALFQQICSCRDAYFQAFTAGDREAARHVIDLHDGDGSFNALPSRVRDYILATTATNVLDWHSGTEMDEPLEAYAGIEVPTLVVRGGRCHPYVARSAGILRDAMPNACLVTVPGAAHSMMATHGAQVARLLFDHISRSRRQPRRRRGSVGQVDVFSWHDPEEFGAAAIPAVA